MVSSSTGESRMSWTPPANRSNQHIKRYHADLYPMPVSDTTGQLTRLTQSVNRILDRVTFKYTTGMRVYFVTPKREGITGTIESCEWNLGLNEYVIRGDDGKCHIIAENGVKFVLSIVVSNQCTSIIKKVA